MIVSYHAAIANVIKNSFANNNVDVIKNSFANGTARKQLQMGKLSVNIKYLGGKRPNQSDKTSLVNLPHLSDKTFTNK